MTEEETQAFYHENDLSLEIVEREWKERLTQIDNWVDLLHKIPPHVDMGVIFALTYENKIVGCVVIGDGRKLVEIINEIKSRALGKIDTSALDP